MEKTMTTPDLDFSDLREAMGQDTDYDRALSLAQTLRSLADIITSQPEHVARWETLIDEFSKFVLTREELRAYVDMLAPFSRQTLGGERGLTKHYDSDLFATVQGYLGVIPFRIVMDRKTVCERIVTGTEKVTRMVPDPEAPMVEITEERETVEWRCASFLDEIGRGE